MEKRASLFSMKRTVEGRRIFPITTSCLFTHSMHAMNKWLSRVILRYAPHDTSTTLFSGMPYAGLPMLACRIPLIRPGSAGQPPGVALLYNGHLYGSCRVGPPLISVT